MGSDRNQFRYGQDFERGMPMVHSLVLFYKKNGEYKIEIG